MSPSRPSKRTLLLAAASLCAAVFLAFGPALGGGFVWDDAGLIADNAALRGLDFARLRWMATSLDHSTYQPLGWLAYALIGAASGWRPFGFHAAGLGLHAVCAVLLFFVSRRLFESARLARPAACAFAAALLWTVHPLHVGTVAWATEIPDQLATAFALASTLAYLARDAKARLPLSLGLFVLSGLCRWKGAGLPLVLAALDVYPLGRLKPSRRDPLDRGNERVWFELLCFALVAVAVVFVNSLAKGAARFEPAASPGTVLRGLSLPLGLLAWPSRLMPLYDLGRSGGAVLPALGLVVALFAWRRRLPAAPAALACYLAGLLPPLLNAKHGLTFFYPHYAYLSTMGLFVAGAAALDAAARRVGPRAVLAATLILAAAWGGLSRRLAPAWGDELRLWTRASVLDEESVLSRGNLGAALARRGRYHEAYFHFQAAERLSRGNYRWNQAVQSDNLRLLREDAPGLEPDPDLFRAQFERARREVEER